MLAKERIKISRRGMAKFIEKQHDAANFNYVLILLKGTLA